VLCLGSRGGGTAGKQTRNSTTLNFQRHVPKFLQPYAHMLGQKPQDQEEPQVAMLEQLRSEQAGDDEEEDKAVEEVRHQPDLRYICCVAMYAAHQSV